MKSPPTACWWGGWPTMAAALAACAARELAPGSVVPDLVEGNLRQRDAVSAAVEETLSSVAGRTHWRQSTRTRSSSWRTAALFRNGC